MPSTEPPSERHPAASRVLTLRIEDDAARIRGSVADEAGASREFSGWLGLARALERTLEPGAPPRPDGAAAERR